MNNPHDLICIPVLDLSPGPEGCRSYIARVIAALHARQRLNDATAFLAAVEAQRPHGIHSAAALAPADVRFEIP